MPFKDPEKRSKARRCSNRTRRHGHWRHIIDWWNGLCATCGEEMHELHEPFGEDNSKFQLRIPLCKRCHDEETQGFNFDSNRNVFFPSKYIEDIEEEISECGGHAEWCQRYKIPSHEPTFQGVLC